MRVFKSVLASSAICFGMALPAFAASPDIYVVNFRSDSNSASVKLDSQLNSATVIAGVRAEDVTVDISTAAKWEKGAHDMYDRDLVPVFNKWVGLTGFAAVVDAESKRVIGCVYSHFDIFEMTQELRTLASRASRAYEPIGVPQKKTLCPPAFDEDADPSIYELIKKPNISDQIASQGTPLMYVVMFRADWCTPSKIVEPNLLEATGMLQDDSIEFVTFDISTPESSELSTRRASDIGLVSQYNSWMGVTGFAAIVDGDTKKTLGCVNRLNDAHSTARHIENLKSYAYTDESIMARNCPESNAPR